jgi:hypothetical protein
MQQSDLDLMMLFTLIKERRTPTTQSSRDAGTGRLERIRALVRRSRRPEAAPARSPVRPGSAVGP